MKELALTLVNAPIRIPQVMGIGQSLWQEDGGMKMKEQYFLAPIFMPNSGSTKRICERTCSHPSQRPDSHSAGNGHWAVSVARRWGHENERTIYSCPHFHAKLWFDQENL